MKNNDTICDFFKNASKVKQVDALELKINESTSVNASIRLGTLENLERSESLNISVRVIIGKKLASISSNINSIANCRLLLDRVIDMAKVVPDDNYCGLPLINEYATNTKELDILEKIKLSEKTLIEDAKKAEESSLSIKGINNSEGANRSWSKNKLTLFSSLGFHKNYSRTTNSLSVIAIAGEGVNMERDYEYTVATYSKDLMDSNIVGKNAAKMAVSRLNPRKVKSCKLDVLFSPRAGSSLLSTFAASINGNSIARGTSFLRKKMATDIFNSDVTVFNDPHILRGLRSKPFDAEGIKNSKIPLINKGNLCNWMLDSRSARQLNLTTQGNSSPTNLYMQNGKISKEEILSNIKKGLFVTEMMGMSFNPINGDYSRGASGFWIENGEITFPVSEITIAGNMLDMYKKLTPANDLEFKSGIDVPTLLIEDMTLAGL